MIPVRPRKQDRARISEADSDQSLGARVAFSTRAFGGTPACGRAPGEIPARPDGRESGATKGDAAMPAEAVERDACLDFRGPVGGNDDAEIPASVASFALGIRGAAALAASDLRRPVRAIKTQRECWRRRQHPEWRD